MKSLIALALVIVFFASTSATNQTPGNAFSTAKVLPPLPFEPERFDFSIGLSQYTVSKEGKGSITTQGTKRRSFDLSLERNDRLVRVYYADYEGELLLIGEVTDDVYGAGFVARLDTRALKMKWKCSIPAFNVGQALIYEGNVYVTGVGFVGKINLRSGKYHWRHEDLYRRNNKAFSFFAFPEIDGTTVTFREEPSPYRKKIALIVIDRVTGRIVKIDT